MDIWVFNNQPAHGWVPRCNAVFDMHPPEDIHRRRTEHQAFDRWVNEKRNIPFYTPIAIPEIPDNVVYPLDEVVNDLFPNFRRGEDVVQYFTSGPAYAIALAIHMGYKRIEMWGIEMESNTEYIYQRDGIALLFGIGAGRGIDMFVPRESIMFYAPLYGYHQDATKVDREAFEARASELEQVMQVTMKVMNEAGGKLSELIVAITEAQARKATEQELQTLGQRYEAAQNDYEQKLANHAFVNGQYVACREWQSRVEKAMEYNGKAQELLAQNAGKWNRYTDKVALSGKILPDEQPQQDKIHVVFAEPQKAADNENPG